MKTVYPSHELPHIFANNWRDQGHARNSSNLSFEPRHKTPGDAIASDYYSYSTGIAVICDSLKGLPEFALVSEETHSVTTGGHISAIRQALNCRVFYVPGAERGSKLQLKLDRVSIANAVLSVLADRIRENAPKIPRARSNQSWLIDQNEKYGEQMRDAWRFFRGDVAMPAKWEKVIRLSIATIEELQGVAKLDREQRAKAKAKRERDIARHNERMAKLEVERLAKDKILLERWIARDWHCPVYSQPVRLRVSADNTEIQTSHGASVPIPQALTLYRAWRRGKARGVTVGHNYQVVSVDDETIKIGCHKIPMTEVSRVIAPLAE